jgi:hypothetical protein
MFEDIKDDGGSAFPMQDPQAIHAYAVAYVEGITDPTERDRIYIQARAAAVGGMSLRDYFAAKVFPIAAVGAHRSGEDFLRIEHYEDAAVNAYRLADAMLEARSEPKQLQYREMYPSEQEKVEAAERLARIVEDLQKAPGWADLPEELRIAARNVAIDVLEPPLPF